MKISGIPIIVAMLAVGVTLAPAKAQAGEDDAPAVERRLQRAEKIIRDLQDEVQSLKAQDSHRATASAEEPANTMRVFWKGGLHAETKDKKFTTKIGGRIQNDWASGNISSGLQDALGDFKNGTEFRRARLYIAGTMYGNIDYKAQYDFAGGDADFKDAYLGISDLPVVGKVRIGQFKEPFSLEELTSSNYITFMERSLANAFAPGRSTGIMLHDTIRDKRMTWALGTFRASNSFGNESSDKEFGVSGRFTALPVYRDNGRTLLHVGVAAQSRPPGSGTLSFGERPELHLADDFVDTGTFAADTVTTVGLEAALVNGPASLQAEYIGTYVDAPGGNDPAFRGFYVFGSYFLTGEHRPYKQKSASFSSVTPKRNFGIGTSGGPGAWELAARFSELDLDDEAVRGGTLRDVTLGMNWYLNHNVRVMANWVHSDRQGTGTADLFGGRFQVFF